MRRCYLKAARKHPDAFGGWPAPILLIVKLVRERLLIEGRLRSPLGGAVPGGEHALQLGQTQALTLPCPAPPAARRQPAARREARSSGPKKVMRTQFLISYSTRTLTQPRPQCHERTCVVLLIRVQASRSSTRVRQTSTLEARGRPVRPTMATRQAGAAAGGHSRRCGTD